MQFLPVSQSASSYTLAMHVQLTLRLPSIACPFLFPMISTASLRSTRMVPLCPDQAWVSALKAGNCVLAVEAVAWKEKLGSAEHG